MHLPRLSLPVVLAVLIVPSLALAAPAATVSELFQRFVQSDGTRQFSVEGSFVDPTTQGTTTLAVHGKMTGSGPSAIAHGAIEITSQESGAEAQKMRLRMAMIDQVLYLKLSKADQGMDPMNMQDDLGVDPWLAIPLNAQEALQADNVADAMFGMDSATLASLQAIPNDFIDGLFSITSAVSDGQGGTNYTIGLSDRPVLALAKIFSGLMPMMDGTTDVDHDLEIRRLDGWVRDAVTFLAHLNEKADGTLGASDLSVAFSADDSGKVSLTASMKPLSETFTLVKPLLTISLDELTADQSMGDSTWNPIQMNDEIDYGSNLPADSCSFSDVRRGFCPLPYHSRRTLGQ